MTTLRVFRDAAALGDALAAEIVAGIAAAAGAGRRYLLGCPGGRSLVPTYEAVAARLRDAPRDLGHVVVVMMDDYLEDGSEPARRVPAGVPHSCERFARERIAGPWTRAARHGVPAANVWLPEPGDPGGYDERIAAAGGVDLFLLATGASDGHVAFNPPGAGLAARTRVLDLAHTTRRDNVATFPHFGTVDRVPRRGVSVGLGTIAGLSRRVRLVATGTGKSGSVDRVLAATGHEPRWPATVVHACRDAELWADRAAAAGVSRPRTA